MKKLIWFRHRVVRSPVYPHGTGCRSSMSPRKAASRPSPYPTCAAPVTPRSSWPPSTRLSPPTSKPPAVSRSSPRHRFPPSSRSSLPISSSPRRRPPRPPSADANSRRSPSSHQRWGSLDAGLVQPARPGQLPRLRLHRRAERGAGAAGLALRSEPRIPPPTPNLSANAISGRWMKPAPARSRMNSPPTLLLCSAVNPYSALISISPATVPATKKSG